MEGNTQPVQDASNAAAKFVPKIPKGSMTVVQKFLSDVAKNDMNMKGFNMNYKILIYFYLFVQLFWAVFNLVVMFMQKNNAYEKASSTGRLVLNTLPEFVTLFFLIFIFALSKLRDEIPEIKYGVFIIEALSSIIFIGVMIYFRNSSLQIRNRLAASVAFYRLIRGTAEILSIVNFNFGVIFTELIPALFLLLVVSSRFLHFWGILRVDLKETFRGYINKLSSRREKFAQQPLQGGSMMPPPPPPPPPPQAALPNLDDDEQQYTSFIYDPNKEAFGQTLTCNNVKPPYTPMEKKFLEQNCSSKNGLQLKEAFANTNVSNNNGILTTDKIIDLETSLYPQMSTLSDDAAVGYDIRGIVDVKVTGDTPTSKSTTAVI